MNLQETTKLIEERAQRLQESANRLFDGYERDSFNLGVARQDQLLIDNLGVETAAKLSMKRMESRRSARQVREALQDMEKQHVLREANALTTDAALIRLGVQEIMADAWKNVAVVWDKVMFTTTSEGFYGIIANAFRPSLPREVPIRGEFPEAKFDPMSKLYVNAKFGQILSVEKELVDDDQTSQVGMKFKQIGENVAYWHEANFAAYLSDAPVTVADYTAYPDLYTDPDGTTGVYASTGNRTNSFGFNLSPTFEFVSQAQAALKLIKDTEGKPVLADPDTIVYEPTNHILIQRTFSAQADQVFSTNPGIPLSIAHGITANNPLKGVFKLVECRFLPAEAWYLGSSKSYSLIWAERDALQVLQEAPDSGKSFENDLVRYRTRKRGKNLWAPGGARFWFQGNTG